LKALTGPSATLLEVCAVPSDGPNLGTVHAAEVNEVALPSRFNQIHIGGGALRTRRQLNRWCLWLAVGLRHGQTPDGFQVSLLVVETREWRAGCSGESQLKHTPTLPSPQELLAALGRLRGLHRSSFGPRFRGLRQLETKGLLAAQCGHWIGC
jgi:hypothetical protein